MTRLLLLSVQRIFKNLNKIRGKIFHPGESPIDAIYNVCQSLLLSKQRRRYCDEPYKECEEIVHFLRVRHMNVTDQCDGGGAGPAMSIFVCPPGSSGPTTPARR